MNYRPLTREEELKWNPEFITFTCIEMRNLMGSDSPLMPTPVHYGCWAKYGADADYTRVQGCQQFVARKKGKRDGEWAGPSMPPGTACWFCGEEI